MFSDPENKGLTYQVIAGNNDALKLNLSENKLQLTSLQSPGVTDVVIRATDAGDHSVVHQFAVTTSNLDKKAIVSLNTNLAELNAAMNPSSDLTANLDIDPTEKALNDLTATFVENPDLLKLLAKPESFSLLGIDDGGAATLNKLLKDPDLAEELGWPVSLGEALSQPDSTFLDKFLVNAIDVEGLIPSDAKQPRIGIIDFSRGQHIQRVSGALAAVNPLAKSDNFTVKNGDLAAQLVKLVNLVCENGEQGAIANLSFDLSQLDDIGITTRYEFIPEEQQAIQYARENNVLLVVAAGNTGDVMSALGAASKQFDNIITVGAVNQLERKTDYSAIGEGLSIVAPGGEWDDDPNAFVGTSRATPYVTAAASLVWAANPGLSYQQVKKLLLETAADLDVPGWDKNTGAGLLDVKEAVSRALYIEPIVSDSPDAPFSISAFSGEGRVQTLERAASEPTEQAIKSLVNTQESLFEQRQALADLGNPALTLSELEEAAKTKIAEAVEKYQQVSTEAAITTAQAQQWAEALALATQHYQIEKARLQALEAQKKKLEEKLVKFGEEKTALVKETETLLANIKEQIAKAEADLPKAKDKLTNPFGDADDSLQFSAEAVRQSALRQQELAQQFQSQSLGFDVERQRYAELAAGINTQRWQVVGSEKGRSGRTKEVWGLGIDPQQQKLKDSYTHVDHNWILWSQYSQIFPQLRQQGIANLVEADKWRKVVERIEPLAKQWTEANNAANEAEPPIKEARNLFAQLEAARAEISLAKTQQELLETLLPTLRQQLEKAEAEAAAQNAKVEQEWEEYDTDSEEYRAAVAEILTRRGELNKQAIETQQQLADAEKWVERQSVALGEELASTKALTAKLAQQKQAIANQILELVKQGVMAEDLDELNTNLAQVNRSVEMLTNKAAILTSQQTALTQKRTMLTAQNEVILAEERLLDAYMKDPDGDYSNLQAQLNDARAALAEAQRLAEQAEAASKILTAPLQQLKEDLLVQNDEHLNQARESQRIVKALVEATQANANYTLQAAQKQHEVNNLEFQILQRLQQATDAGYKEAKALLDVAKNNDIATAAEIYYRDYSDLAGDRGGCAGGAGNAEDQMLADRYYGEMLNNRELQRRAQAQADAFGAARRTAEAQIKTMQAQQEIAAKLLNDLNAKIAKTQEERETKEQELAVAKARLDGITRIREQTEQTFVQLISIDKLNLAQAQLEQQIAKQREAGINAAVEARMERDALELERQRQATTAKIEQLKQLQAEDELRRSLNNVRGELGLETLEATEDPVQLQTQLAGLLTSLKDLESQQPELPENVKALLAEARADIHLALQGKEAAGIQENLLNAMGGLIEPIQQYKSEINRIDLEEQWDTQLLQTAQTDLQGASKQFLEELRRAEELSGEKQIIDPLYQEALIKVAYAEQAVEISEDLAKQSKEMLEQIIKQRVAERKARKKAFWNKILGIISQVAGILSTVLMILSPAFPALIPFSIGLGAVSGAINTIQAVMNGDWMGAIFSGVMTGLTAISGGLGQMASAGAKAAAQTIKTLQTIASGAFSGARSLMSGESIMGFLQILGSVATAASAGMGSFINQLSAPLQKVMLSVVQSLQQAPQMIYGGIKAIQSGDWLDAIGKFFNGAMAIGQSFAGNFNTAVAGILENVSKVGNTALYLGNAIKDGGIEGWLSGIDGILGL